MRACGVDFKGSEARLAIVAATGDGLSPIPCNSKKIILKDDKDNRAIQSFLQTVISFAHSNKIDTFAIKSRAHGGKMGGGAISFKMETLFQLTNCKTVFINPVALAKFSKTNLAGLPTVVLKYQEDAYRCAAFHLSKIENDK